MIKQVNLMSYKSKTSCLSNQNLKNIRQKTNSQRESAIRRGHSSGDECMFLFLISHSSGDECMLLFKNSHSSGDECMFLFVDPHSSINKCRILCDLIKKKHLI